jgi:hypothetical protein
LVVARGERHRFAQGGVALLSNQRVIGGDQR